jgi:hypothetical protein
MTFGEKTEASRKSREQLLEKFKRREQQRKDFEEQHQGEASERGSGGGEGTPD